MNCYNIASVADMTKKPTETKISEKKKSKRTKTKDNNNNNSGELSTEDEKSIQIANVIPALEERFSVSKKTLTERTKIEKRWITKTKKIEVPIASEEVYINDTLMKSYEKGNQEEDVLSEVNKQIVQSFEEIDNDDTKKKQYSILESNESTRELTPLFYDLDNNNKNDNSTKSDVNANKKTKKIIPILGEQVIVSKRIVQIGELVITKNKVVENKKIAVDTVKEKVTVRYPDGNTTILG